MKFEVYMNQEVQLLIEIFLIINICSFYSFFKNIQEVLRLKCLRLLIITETNK